MTVSKKVFITGASGNTGRHVLKHLCSERELDIHAGIYKDEDRQLVSQLCPTATIHKIDADHMDTVVNAMQGSNDVFIIPTVGEAKVHHGKTYINAAKKAGVKFVLLLSMIGADNPKYLLAEEFKEIESTLLQAEIESWCIIRSGFYTQNLLLYKQQVKEGYLPLPIGKGSFAPVDADDIGMMAKTILHDCSKHRHKVYSVTGPKALTGTAMAERASEALGRKIEYKDITPDDAKTILLSQQIPVSDAKGLLEFYNEVSHARMDVRVEDFMKVSNAQPTPVDEFFKRHKTEFNK